MTRAALIALFVSFAGGCVLDPAGRCDTRADCGHGLDCLQGVCAACRGDFDCSGWESCGGDGLCAPLAGRCDADADCATWDACDASHTCVLRADHCPNVACGALERCDPERHCTFQPGRCLAATDCPAWMASCDAVANRCRFSATAGDDVLAWGTLAEGTGDRSAVARVTAPTKVEVGFDAEPAPPLDRHALVDPITGELVYRHTGDAGGDTLRRFNRDAISGVTGYWTYPAAPSADDEIAIDASACPMTWDRWVMQGADGTEPGPMPLLYGCPHAGSVLRDFYGAGSVPMPSPGLQGIQEALAWSANGYVLAGSATGVLQVVSSAGVVKPVTALPAGGHLAHRTTADAWTGPPGFRVALGNEVSGKDELWEIDELTAAATFVGTYADVASGYKGVEWEILDSAGNLYGRAYIGSPELILKRPLSPGLMGLPLYSEASMPPGSNDFTAATFMPFLRLDQGSFLITTP